MFCCFYFCPEEFTLGCCFWWPLAFGSCLRIGIRGLSAHPRWGFFLSWCLFIHSRLWLKSLTWSRCPGASNVVLVGGIPGIATAQLSAVPSQKLHPWERFGPHCPRETNSLQDPPALGPRVWQEAPPAPLPTVHFCADTGPQECSCCLKNPLIFHFPSLFFIYHWWKLHVCMAVMFRVQTYNTVLTDALATPLTSHRIIANANSTF